MIPRRLETARSGGKVLAMTQALENHPAVTEARETLRSLGYPAPDGPLEIPRPTPEQIDQTERDLRQTAFALEALVETVERDVPEDKRGEPLAKLLADSMGLILHLRQFGKVDTLYPEYRDVPLVYDPKDWAR